MKAASPPARNGRRSETARRTTPMTAGTASASSDSGGRRGYLHRRQGVAVPGDLEAQPPLADLDVEGGDVGRGGEDGNRPGGERRARGVPETDRAVRPVGHDGVAGIDRFRGGREGPGD